ncbi:histone deacetylase family protein [Geotalea toluenoxydans]
MRSLEKKFTKGEGRFVLFSHPDCLLHQVREGHPETPARLESILRGCAALPASLPVSFQVPPQATVAQLQLVHEEKYLLELEAACRRGDSLFMTPDNHICPDTFRAVLAAAGCALALGETLLEKGAGFALARPPGHHAGRKSAEGFCFVNHIALAIETIRQRQPAATFLVVDFDVHHGNGIDYIYYNDPKVFYYSLHGTPDHIYPHSGYVHETGQGPGAGFTCNITLPLDTSGDEWLRQFALNLECAAHKIRPDYVLVGAGFDAHRQDPFGVMNVEDRHFLRAVRLIHETARNHCGGKAGFFLEGGYSTAVLERLVPEIITILASGADSPFCPP